MNKVRLLFYLLSFIEGASVMAAELLGAKMMAPSFGSSLYVWASVLGVTLAGLATGYFTGGVVSEKKSNERNLYAVLLASAIFIIVMPLSAREVMLHTAGYPLLVSILITSFVFLFPPVFFMGMVSPMIVKVVAACHPAGQEERSGKAAGTVYAISTLGGIVSTFLLGFYLIPEFGLIRPAMVMGCLLGIIPFIKLISARKFYSLLFPLAAFFSFNTSFKDPEVSSSVRILYSSEGLLGQVIVADYPLYEGPKGGNGFQRILFVNRSTQTVVIDRQGKKEPFEYVDIISARSIDAESPQKALVLGLGGGSVANALSEKGFKVDAVELDERMVECAKNYFDLSANVNVTVDDARHFVSGRKEEGENNEEYQVVVLDAFIGEVNPHHLFTKEFFSEITSLLSDSGTFFINGNGFWSGEAGKGMRSVCKTLLASGFDVELVPTRETEDFRNLLFVCRKSAGGQGSVTSEKLHSLDLAEDAVLADDKPQLEILNAGANKKWREACLKYFLSGYYSGQDRLIFK